jgi:diaminopimelate decarboxylase
MTDPSAAALIAARPQFSTHALDGLLLVGVPLLGVAADFGTPCYVYGAGTVRARCRRLRAAMPGVDLHYAVKALDHLAILTLIAAEGFGADVVSGGELLRALRAGFAPERIVFSGVGKTQAELRLALDHGVGQINVESAEEFGEIADIANAAGQVARVAFRVNPDVDAGTHDKISTGRAGDKFGIAPAHIPALYAEAAARRSVEPCGLAVHIGSQIFAMAPFEAAYARLALLVRELRGAGMPVPAVDCGGGLGVGYRGEPEAMPEAWAAVMRHSLGPLDVRLSAEPGRWLVAGAGVLLASVIRTKRAGMARPIVVLDAAMNDLARPAMYGAWHGIVPAGPADLVRAPEPADIVGPVCESSDVFARGRMLPPLAPGAILAILDAGAYGAVMSSTYNARPSAAQVLVDGGTATLITPRGRPEALFEEECVPRRQETIR